MGRRFAWAVLVLASVCALGVGSAGGRTLDSATVIVDVIGKGQITSNPEGIRCGAGKTTCYLTFTSSLTLAREASPNWTFDHWEGACGGGGSTCVVNSGGGGDRVVIAVFKGPPAPSGTLSVTFDSSNGDGTVTAPQRTSGTEINCGPEPSADDCNWDLVNGSVVTLLETPASGAVFNGWGGACSGTSVACTVEIDGSETVSAAWVDSSTTATLNVSVSGDGRVTGPGIDCPSVCSASVPINSTVTLTAEPGDGQVFGGWPAPCATSTALTCTFTMSSTDASVGVAFTAAIVLNVAVVGNGSVSGGTGAISCGSGATVCSAIFAQNATLTLIATPSTGATFIGWTGACGGTSTTCTVLMNQSKNVTATFSAPGGGGGGGTTVTLSVDVSGNGTITGGGIACGLAGSTCTVEETLNSTVILTATPGPGATFVGWGGACTGITGPACTLSMTITRGVTATFTGGAPQGVQLAVGVTGRGTVTGGGIRCGNGAPTCTVTITPGTTVTLTAKAAAGAKFVKWGGACAASKAKATCTLTVSLTTTVTAEFSGGAAAGGGVLTAAGKPVVRAVKGGFTVTLRVKTTQAGVARVRGLRAGRAAVSFSVRVAVGTATIGPFQVKRPGLYTFQITLAGHTLHWRTCLGLCGAKATAPRFTLKREPPVVTLSGAVWSVTLKFRATQISDSHIRVYRDHKLLADHHFLGGAREIIAGPFLLGPGSYTIRLTAVDPYGRVRTLDWLFDLAR
jgi:uncharacterized repeat protein (TIGR02543 family)